MVCNQWTASPGELITGLQGTTVTILALNHLSLTGQVKRLLPCLIFDA
jgi:hypothetical protein